MNFNLANHHLVLRIAGNIPSSTGCHPDLSILFLVPATRAKALKAL